MSTPPLTMPAASVEAGPVPAQERLPVLDILRGFALFGILLVNMGLFKAPVSIETVTATTAAGSLDQFVAYAIDLLAEGKFFTLFSFLFGLGFALQLDRAEQRGANGVSRFVRRLLALLVIGLAHAVFLWNGDILATYALLGLLLIPFRRRPSRTIIRWAVGLLVGMTLLAGAGVGVIEVMRFDPAGRAAITVAEAEALATARAEAARQLAVYRDGSYADALGDRLGIPQGMLFILVTQSVPILAMFLLGLYAGRHGILTDIGAHRAVLRRVRTWGLLLGLLAGVLIVLAKARLDLFSSLLAGIFLNHTLAGPLLALGYAATLALLAQDGGWLRRLAPLGAAGRLALTNYLLQSLVCTTLFYGYGFGLFGQVGVAAGVLLTAGIYALQLVWSVWWLCHFQIGPAEWLLRTLTYYGRAQPLRRRLQPSVADQATPAA
jgi:uncharacterized protein